MEFQWPPIGGGGVLSYSQLSAQDKEVVDTHLLLAEELQEWQEVRTILVDEFHAKKSRHTKHGRCHPVDAGADRIYKQCIFLNRPHMTCFDCFPSDFERELENVLTEELSRPIRFDFAYVYYNHRAKSHKLQVSRVDAQDWELSNELRITPLDREVLACYKTGFITFLTRCGALVRQYKGAEHSKPLEKEIKHISKCMTFI